MRLNGLSTLAKRALLGMVLTTIFATVARAELTVFAAASLRGALDEVNAVFDGTAVATSYASSASLARQVSQGAPADVFVSANAAWMQVLVDQGFVAGEGPVTLLQNRLVLIGATEAPSVTLDELPHQIGAEKLAMGFVNAVPAGIYGKAALENLGLWQGLKPSVVQTDNVRAALALVALGEAQYGIVYVTDALAEPDVRVLAEIPQDAHAVIEYPAAQLSDTTLARAYLDHLQSAEAREIFLRHGFLMPGGQ